MHLLRKLKFRAITVHLVYDDMLEELRRYAKERKAEICR